MRCSAIYFLLTLCWAGLWFAPSDAFADSKTEAKRRFENGKALYTEENYQGAAAEFKASVEAYPTKNGYFNLANCQKALHRYDLALKTLEELKTRFGAELKEDNQLLAKIDELERSIRDRSGLLSVTSTPPGAQIFVDGEQVGAAPLPRALILGPGEHIVEAKLDGYVSAEKSVSILSKNESRVAFQLEPEQARLSVTVSAPGAEIRLDGAPVGRSPLQGALSVAPGQRAVDVSLPGYRPEHRELNLEPGEEILLDVNLVSVAGFVPAEPFEQPSISTRTLTALAWTGLGTALVIGSASGVLFHFRGEAIDEYGKQDLLFVDPSISDTEAASYDDRRDRAALRAKVFHGFGIATAITAGVCAVGSLTAAVLAAKQKKREPASAVQIQAGLSSVEVNF